MKMPIPNRKGINWNIACSAVPFGMAVKLMPARLVRMVGINRPTHIRRTARKTHATTVFSTGLLLIVTTIKLDRIPF